MRMQDGFIHLTKGPGLLLTVANHFYKDVPGDWYVLGIDSSMLTSKVRCALDMQRTVCDDSICLCAAARSCMYYRCTKCRDPQ